MMRIAIAGGGGFAWILAGEIAHTASTVLVLSTRVSRQLILATNRELTRKQEHPEFEPLGAQVAVVDYSDVEGLRYTLQGVELVISTISGDPQLNLIEAARSARVRTFVPSEFEGALVGRPTTNDPFSRGSEAALGLLQQWPQSNSPPHAMRYTVFSCGVFYERFGPGGLALLNISTGPNVHNAGDYLVNVGNATAEIVEFDAHGMPVVVSMTSVYDVARFVAAAIEMGPNDWPTEFRMRGDQLTVRDIFRACSSVRNSMFIYLVFFSDLSRKDTDQRTNRSAFRSDHPRVPGHPGSPGILCQHGQLATMVLFPTAACNSKRTVHVRQGEPQ